MPAIDHTEGGTLPIPPDDEIVAPFISQTTRLPLLSSPEDVARAVAVEVAGADHRPGGRQVADTADEATCVPFMNQIAVLPLVSRHSRSALPSPSKSRCPTIDQLVGTAPNLARRQDRRAVHQPDRGIAADVAPGDVAHAVAVEVVGVGLERLRRGEDPGRADVRVVVVPPTMAVLPSAERATEVALGAARPRRCRPAWCPAGSTPRCCA